MFSSPISREETLAFQNKAQDEFQAENVNIEEVILQYRLDVAVGDRASSASSPAELKILERVAAQADRSSINCRTQDPILDGSARLPGDMLIGIFGCGARINLSSVGAAPDAIDMLAIGQGIDESVLVCKQGALRRFELPGDVFTSVGQGQARYGIAVDTDEANASQKDRGWYKTKPLLLGKDQQLTLSLFVNRTSDWPQAFAIRFMFPALIARIK